MQDWRKESNSQDETCGLARVQGEDLELGESSFSQQMGAKITLCDLRIELGGR